MRKHGVSFEEADLFTTNIAREIVLRALRVGLSAVIDAVIVPWPDGARERWTDVGADRVVTFRRGRGARRSRAAAL